MIGIINTFLKILSVFGFHTEIIRRTEHKNKYYIFYVSWSEILDKGPRNRNQEKKHKQIMNEKNNILQSVVFVPDILRSVLAKKILEHSSIYSVIFMYIWGTI